MKEQIELFKDACLNSNINTARLTCIDRASQLLNLLSDYMKFDRDDSPFNNYEIRNINFYKGIQLNVTLPSFCCDFNSIRYDEEKVFVYFEIVGDLQDCIYDYEYVTLPYECFIDDNEFNNLIKQYYK